MYILTNYLQFLIKNQTFFYFQIAPTLDFILKDLSILLETVQLSKIGGRLSKSKETLRKHIKHFRAKKYLTLFKTAPFTYKIISRLLIIWAT